MSANDLFQDVHAMMEECRHGLTKRTCSTCLSEIGWGKLESRPYRVHLEAMFPEQFEATPTKVRYCEECARRGANKGNRVNVRLPRERRSFNVGAIPLPPSWQGPLVTKPKIRKATHRIKGKWLCDRCDPQHAVGEVSEPIFGEADIFA